MTRRSPPTRQHDFTDGLPRPVVRIEIIADYIGVSRKKASEYAANGTLARWGMVPFKAGSKHSPWLVRTEEVAAWLTERWEEAGGR